MCKQYEYRKYQTYLINVIMTQQGRSDFTRSFVIRPGKRYPGRYTIGQHDREANYHSVNSTMYSPLGVSRPLYVPSIIPVLVNRIKIFASRRVGSLGAEPWVKKKRRIVEIISGRDRRLQGEGEETGPRLQRDRSGVSEMEPLPAAQDALRLELKSTRSLKVRHLLHPFSSSPLFMRDSRDDGRFSRSFSPSSSSSSSLLSL